MAYADLSYAYDKWVIDFHEFPQTISYDNYARVHVFNLKIDSLTQRWLYMKLNKISEEEYQDITNLSGFLILKYPFSAVPQSY